MRPEDYPYNHNAILHIWQEYRHGTNADISLLLQDVDPIISESWAKCQANFQKHSQRPQRLGNSQKTTELLQQHKELISVATPFLEDIRQLFTGAHVVFLSDHQGRILALELDPTVSHIYQRLGFGVGELWVESQVGTNAITLALNTAMAVQVVGAEHYLQIYHDFAHTAAPVHGNEGEIIGTIGIVTLFQHASASQLVLVTATARAITNQLLSDALLDQANQRLMQLDAIIESVTDGLITWNMQGRVEHINSTACKLLGIKRSTLQGHPIDSITGLAPHLRDIIANQESLSDSETLLQIGERIVRCMISVRTIYDQQNSTISGIAMLRSLSQVRNLVNQQSSNTARLTFDNFYAKSSVIRKVLRQAEVAARASAPIILYGESGVGKTSLAQAIHNASPRSKKPLITVNCSAIPHEMILNELLGIEGYGSENARPSKFELADGGTILIDQIDQLSLEGQAVLQDVIDTRHVMRLNSKRATPVNTRVIATTHVDIDALVAAGNFTKQLYFRFSVFKFHLPPLRQRKEDIEVLVERFLNRSQIPYIVEDNVLDVLKGYPWPGNVRELESVMERALLHSENNIIHVMDLPENVRTNRLLEAEHATTRPILTLQDAEREAIVQAGWACRGAISLMAQALGINRSTLWRKMNQFGITADDFK